jgi:hypothetical protein
MHISWLCHPSQNNVTTEIWTLRLSFPLIMGMLVGSTALAHQEFAGSRDPTQMNYYYIYNTAN